MAVDERRQKWDITAQLHARMTEVARSLRRETTRSEAILWNALRGRQLAGHKFR